MVQASQLWLVSLRHRAPLLDDPQQSPAQRWEVAIHSDKGHTSTQCPVQRGCLTNWCEHTKAEIPWYHEIPWNNTGGLALLETGTNTWWLAKKVTKHGKHCLEYSGYVRCCDIRFFNAYLGKLCIYIKWETKQIIPTGLKEFSEPVPTSGWNLETMHRLVRTLC